MVAKEVGIKRTFLTADGSAMEYAWSEKITSEAVKQALFSSKFCGEPIGKYSLLDNSYRATGGFETGEYLIPHPSELIDKYRRRQHLSYYPNYVKPVVDAHVNPIFKTSPTRQNMSEYFEKFVDDVDGKGTTLTRFMKKCAIRAKLHGVEFIVIDMDEISLDSIVTKKTVIDNRLYPYLYLVSPAQVVDWATNKFGKLTYFKYSLQSTVVDENGDKQQISENWTWTETICKKEIGGKETIFTNPIGVIPIVPVYGAINDSDDLVPQSDVYAIARTNYAIYNACSELRERNRNQAFSILTFPIGEDDDYENGDEPLKYGTADCLLYKGTTAPAFITPPANPSDTIMNEINFLIKEIYRMANLQLVTGVQQSNVSGLAKEWDNQNLFQTISELAQGIEEAEYRIASIFSLFTGEDNSSISIAYNNQFGIIDSTTILTNATQSLALNICPEYNIEIKKQVVRATLKDVDDSIIDKVLDNLESDSSARNPLDIQAKVVQPSSGT